MMDTDINGDDSGFRCRCDNKLTKAKVENKRVLNPKPKYSQNPNEQLNCNCSGKRSSALIPCYRKTKIQKNSTYFIH